MKSYSIRARSCGNGDREEGHVGMEGGKEKEKREKRGEESFSDL